MKKVIVAPLNWGLGHAARCIPLIQELCQQGFTPVIASDGAALSFLKQEFPELETLELPSYSIRYGRSIVGSLLKQTPRILSAVLREKKCIENYAQQHRNVVGIISDNRFGVRNSRVPSVYITHQLIVKSGILTPITTYVHQKIIQKFDACWIPDEQGSVLSGDLSKANYQRLKASFIGVLSKFEGRTSLHEKYDVVVVLSGPEPHRTQLETKLLSLLKNTSKKTLCVRGVIEKEQRFQKKGNLTVYNFMLREELEEALLQAKVVVARSGYSTILDLAIIGKKALLVPTPRQPEQEYLGNYMQQTQRALVVKQNDLTLSHLKIVEELPEIKPVTKPKLGALFSLFECK